MNNANFIAIDFETATPKRMPCQIGLVVVKEGVIVKKINELIQPPQNKYSVSCTKVHGITPEHTLNSPTFDILWDKIKPYFDKNFIVAHNIDFDYDVLEKALSYYNIQHPIIMGCACTYQLSETNLEEACYINNIPLPSHHDAACDAEACARLFLKYLDGELYAIDRSSMPKQAEEQTEEQKAYNEFYSNFIQEHTPLTGDILKKDLSNADPNNPFYDKKIVITGVFTQERSDLALTLKNMGADINTSISKKTDFVLIGDEPGYRKIEKLDELERNGCKITRLYQKDLDKVLAGEWDEYTKNL